MNRLLRKKFFLFLLLGELCLLGHAQSKFGGFENIGKKEGMFHANTRTLFKDSKDFLWIGSSDGLMRYDGVVFDLFRRSKKDTIALSDNNINCIIEDENEYIFWIGTAIGGINRFDIVKNTYKHYFIEPESYNNRGIVEINSLYQVNEDCLIVGTSWQGLYFFYPSLQKFIKLEDAYNASKVLPKHIFDIVGGEDYIWVTTSEGLIQFDKKGKFLNLFYFNGKSFNENPADINMPIFHLVEKGKNEILFTSENCLFLYNLQSNSSKKLLELSEHVNLTDVVIDQTGGSWVGSDNNGLYYLSKDQKEVKHFDAIRGKDNNIASNIIQDLFFCKEQSILWAATRKGISKYDYNQIKFTQHNINELTKGLVHDLFMVAKDSKEGYWFWSEEGFYHKEKGHLNYSKIETPPNFAAYQMIEDNKGNLWFATTKGLLRYSLNDKKSKCFEFLDDRYDTENLNKLRCLTQLVDQEIWIACNAGIIKFNVNTFEYKLFPIELLNKENTEFRFTSIAYSSDKTSLWLSSRRSLLWKYDILNETFEIYDLRKDKARPNKPIVILDLEVDKNDNIWLSTFGAGLLIFNPHTKTLSDEVAVDMLESYSYGILSDANDNFWVSSNFGVSKINTTTKKITNYQSKDGAFCEEFNDKSYFKTANGEMLFGGTNGFIEFNPDNLNLNNFNFKLYVNAYTVQNDVLTYGDEIYDDVQYVTDSVINVERTKTAIKFYFSLLNYSHSQGNKMLWKLEGYDEVWNEGYSYEPISYNNLKAGNYILRVKGINNDDYESSNVAKLYVNVKAKFHETLLFKIILGILILSIFFVLYKIRISWYKVQEKNLTRKVEEKTKELVLINDELESSKEEIINQKSELEVHRNYLEDLVQNRTKDLEVAKLKAEESDRLKTAFLANLSHEIRTPMNAIIGFSTLLQTGEFPEIQKKEFLKVINQSSESLLVLIDDIIDISRIETGNVHIVKQNVHIPSLIKETLDELVFEEKSENVRLMQFYELAPDDVKIFTDRYRLKQVISNLIRNAFKFTKDGHVKLTVKTTSKTEIANLGFRVNGQPEKSYRAILFCVEDTGIGINDEEIDFIFEPFRKAKSGSKFYKGMGLGLSIVKNLIHLFGGDIVVKSQVGIGTTFCFYIKVNPEINS